MTSPSFFVISGYQRSSAVSFSGLPKSPVLPKLEIEHRLAQSALSALISGKVLLFSPF